MPTLLQFGYNKGYPKGIPVVDCRKIKNPYGRTKNDAETEAWVRGDLWFERLVSEGVRLVKYGTPVVGVGCSYGRHRSWIVAQEISKRTGVKIERRDV